MVFPPLVRHKGVRTLDLYRRFKKSVELEDYLKGNLESHKRLVVRLRMGGHGLAVEIGMLVKRINLGFRSRIWINEDLIPSKEILALGARRRFRVGKISKKLDLPRGCLYHPQR